VGAKSRAIAIIDRHQTNILILRGKTILPFTRWRWNGSRRRERKNKGVNVSMERLEKIVPMILQGTGKGISPCFLCAMLMTSWRCRKVLLSYQQNRK